MHANYQVSLGIQVHPDASVFYLSFFARSVILPDLLPLRVFGTSEFTMGDLLLLCVDSTCVAVMRKMKKIIVLVANQRTGVII